MQKSLADGHELQPCDWNNSMTVIGDINELVLSIRGEL